MCDSTSFLAGACSATGFSSSISAWEVFWWPWTQSGVVAGSNRITSWARMSDFQARRVVVEGRGLRVDCVGQLYSKMNAYTVGHASHVSRVTKEHS